MEAGFGGPVWHASVMSEGWTDTRGLAYRALEGVGDAALGEWTEDGPAFHLRRRLSVAEVIASGLVMRDFRGTVEGAGLLLKLFQQVPALRVLAIKVGEFR